MLMGKKSSPRARIDNFRLGSIILGKSLAWFSGKIGIREKFLLIFKFFLFLMGTVPCVDS